MSYWERYKPEIDKSLMRAAFDEHKKWLRNNDDVGKIHIGTRWFDDLLSAEMLNDLRKKEKEEMSKSVFTNVKECDLVSVNYNGRTYYVDEFVHEQDVFIKCPMCRVEFVPSPDRFIANAPKDSRCTKCPPNDFRIDKVTFNGPATIVNWKDGTKTIVKCDNESFDPEKGLAMAIVKKVLGNKGNYYNAIRKALDNARYYDTPVDSKSNRFADAVLAGILAGIGLEKKMEQEENKCE